MKKRKGGWQAYVWARQDGLMVAGLTLLADVVSKGEVLKAVFTAQLPWWIVEGRWGMAFSWNRGMSFSMLDGVAYAPLLLAVVAVAACAWFTHWLADGGRWHRVGLGLIIGGAMGNLLDRIQHGAVVDFIVTSPAGLFPYTYNVADACITVGVGLVLLDGFLNKKG